MTLEEKSACLSAPVVWELSGQYSRVVPPVRTLGQGILNKSPHSFVAQETLGWIQSRFATCF